MGAVGRARRGGTASTVASTGGSHQLAVPSSSITAGTSTSLTTVASMGATAATPGVRASAVSMAPAFAAVRRLREVDHVAAEAERDPVPAGPRGVVHQRPRLAARDGAALHADDFASCPKPGRRGRPAASSAGRNLAAGAYSPVVLRRQYDQTHSESLSSRDTRYRPPA